MHAYAYIFVLVGDRVKLVCEHAGGFSGVGWDPRAEALEAFSGVLSAPKGQASVRVCARAHSPPPIRVAWEGPLNTD